MAGDESALSDLKGELALQESAGRILRNGREIATAGKPGTGAKHDRRN